MRYVTRIHGNLLEDLPKLGPAITELDPPSERSHGPPLRLDVEDDENDNSKYALSGRQREILKTNETIKRSDQNDNILKKRDKLPDRVQRLIDDVALLCNSPYTSTEDWAQGAVNRKRTRSRWADINAKLKQDDVDIENIDSSVRTDSDEIEIEYYETPFDSPAELWDEIIDVDQRGQQLRDDVFFAGDSVISKEVQFGYEVGNLLQMLRSPNENDPIGIDLIWGFVLAFIGQPRIDIKKERGLLNEVITEMSDRHDNRMEEADLIPDFEEILEERTEGYRMTAEAIEEKGIEPHPIVVEEVLYHQIEFEDDEKLHKGNARKTLSQIEDVVPLRLVNDLYTRLVADILTIQNETTQEIDSIHHVLEGFESTPADEDFSKEEKPDEESKDKIDGETEDGFSVGSQGIAEISGSVGARKHAVTPVLNRLSSGKGTEQWTTTPIVVNKGDSDEWKLTAYGELLLYLIQYHDGDPSAVYRFAIGPEEISLQDRKLILEVLDEQGDVTAVTS